MLQMIVWSLMMAKTIKGHPDCGMYTTVKASCFLCPPGHFKIRDCGENGTAASCMPCPVGTFQALCSQATTCQPCDSYCKFFNSYTHANCTTTTNLVCECKSGYVLIDQGGGNVICKKHGQCPPGHGMSKPGFNANLQHNISYTWQPILMVEEEPRKTQKRTIDPQEATGKLSHIPTLAKYEIETHTDRGTSMVDVLCEPCVSGETYSNIFSSTQQCQKCSTCVTNVISPCTPSNNTICSSVTRTITDGSSQPASSVIIGVCVTAVAVIISGVGLSIYICKRRRTQKKTNEDKQGKGLKDVHLGNNESTPGPRIPNDDAVIMAVFKIMVEKFVTDFNFLFRDLVNISGKKQKKEDPQAEGPPVDSWIDQSNEDNRNKGVKESHYKLLLRWRQWYGELDNNFFLSIKQALEKSNANEILAQIEKETEFTKYINNNY